MRGITIRGNETTILCIVPSNIAKGLHDAVVTVKNEDGTTTDKNVKYTNAFVSKGNLNANRAMKKAQAKYGKNCMVVGLRVSEAAKLTLDANVFRAHSRVLAENETTTHNEVTAMFKETIVTAMQFDMTSFEQKETQLVFGDVTTENKLLNWVRNTLKDANAVILASHVVTVRRAMTKEQFEALAIAHATKDNNDNNDNQYFIGYKIATIIHTGLVQLDQSSVFVVVIMVTILKLVIMFDEMTLLKNMVSHSIETNCLFVCVSAKDYGYKFFNLNKHDDMVDFATHLSYIQLDTNIADVFIVSREEMIMIRDAELNKAISTHDKVWRNND